MASQGFGFATPNKAGTRALVGRGDFLHARAGVWEAVSLGWSQGNTDKVTPPIFFFIFIERLLCS